MTPARSDRLEQVALRLPVIHAVARLALGTDSAAESVTVAVLVALLRSPRDVRVWDFSRAELADRFDLDASDHATAAFGSEAVGPHLVAAGPDERGPGPTTTTEAVERATTEAVERALSRVDPVDRCVLGFITLDDCTPAQVAELLGRTHAEVNARHTHCLATIEEELSSEGLSSDAVGAVRQWSEAHPAPADLLERATQALRRRRRRRAVAVGVMVVALAGAVLLAGRTVGLTSPEPSRPSVSETGSPTGQFEVTVDKVPISTGVSAIQSADLVPLPGAESDVALPAELGPGAEPLRPLDVTTAADASIRAIFIRRAPDGTGIPVLFVPKAPQRYLALPEILLAPRQPGVVAIGPATVDRERRRAVVVAGADVVVIDVRDASVRRFPVSPEAAQGSTGPVVAVLSVGWADPSGRFVIIQCTDGPRRLDLESGEVLRTVPPVHAGRQELSSEGLLSLRAYDPLGRLVSQRPLTGPVQSFVGPTVTNLGGWSAGEVRWSTGPFLPPGSAGLYAVAVDLSPSASGLFVPDAKVGESICCSVLGWAPGDRLLHLGGTTSAPLILAWDVHSGKQFRVSGLSGLGATAGEWVGEFALSP